MATDLIINFRDGRALGSRESLQTLIRTNFPTIKFSWTTSGAEKLRIAKERGIEFPAALRHGLESLPSLLEGVAEGPGWHILFGLGHLDPVTELVMQARGDYESIEPSIHAIEKTLGTSFRIHDTPAAE